ncbi:MAG: cytochrome ubiquinol oxidase subunit I [Paracoccus sp. (in: a-proteobacteria)]|nr:cytochrome ubiquinol oxidase subunit I [Paracoccus sp. (in: a-proteobacteria)]
MEFGIVELSRLQFAMTALFHFLFVPLTLGLSVLLAIMETVYVMTGRPIWRQMVKFWGKIFGINFVLGVATGITMEFQFGMNWAYYSHYVGDVFGAPLAMEGLMAFFLEATFVGLFFYGWDRLSAVGHLVVTWLVAIGSQFSALWILIANAWMQNPVGAEFNPVTMRMEMTSFAEVIFNETAQAKFVHTVSAGYATGAMFVLGVSCWYLLKGRHKDLAKRSIAVAASFGLAAALSVVVLGDESGYDATHNQKMKLAAIEAMWETEPAPAPFTLVGWPDQRNHETKWAVHIPYVMGLIGTRSLTKEIPGITDLVAEAELRVKSGLVAFDAMMRVREGEDTPALRSAFEENSDNIGYAFLLRQYVDDPRDASEAQIAQAAADTVPHIWPLFWSFRIMVACGFAMILVTGYFFFTSSFRAGRFPRVMLWAGVAAIPLPWIAAEMGWIVAEYGRQPWVVEGVLPTFMAVSHLSASEVLLTILGFAALYTALFVIMVRLVLAAIRTGPTEDAAEVRRWQAAHRNRLEGAK